MDTVWTIQNEIAQKFTELGAGLPDFSEWKKQPSKPRKPRIQREQIIEVGSLFPFLARAVSEELYSSIPIPWSCDPCPEKTNAVLGWYTSAVHTKTFSLC